VQQALLLEAASSGQHVEGGYSKGGRLLQSVERFASWSAEHAVVRDPGAEKRGRQVR